MAGSLVRPHEDRAGTRAMPGGDPMVTRAEGLWTLFGLALFGAFLVFAVFAVGP